jgi:hypothetical protein
MFTAFGFEAFFLCKRDRRVFSIHVSVQNGNVLIFDQLSSISSLLSFLSRSTMAGTWASATESSVSFRQITYKSINKLVR